ncbi:hypothetical protein [Streptomyces sp. NPDC020362]|uniref:hypothetical protein n=1 Tax=unclassified Streptomyces TaxID=2593676 RepID=UPI000A4280FB
MRPASAPPVARHVSKDGLQVHLRPHVCTDEEGRGVLVCICGIKAADGARPGRYTNGTAQIGTAPPAKLPGEVLDPGEED